MSEIYKLLTGIFTLSKLIEVFKSNLETYLEFLNLYNWQNLKTGR